MKYQIYQNVYFIVSLEGLLRIKAMKIDSINADSKGIYYQGHQLTKCLETGKLLTDITEPKEVRREYSLFSSYQDAIQDLKSQIEILEEKD